MPKIEIFASNSLVTVQTTATDQYFVYLPYISSQSKVFTIRDTGNNVSPVNPIIVSTFSNALFTGGISTQQITQNFGFLTITNQSTGLYSVTSASAYPQGATNILSQNLTASTIQATSQVLLQDVRYPTSNYPLTVSAGQLLFNVSTVTQVTSEQFASTLSSFNDIFITSSLFTNYISSGTLQAQTLEVSSLLVYSQTLCSVVNYIENISTGFVEAETLIANFISTNLTSTTQLFSGQANISSLVANSITTDTLTVSGVSELGDYRVNEFSTKTAYISSFVTNSLSTTQFIANSATISYLSAGLVSSQTAFISSLSTNDLYSGRLITTNDAMISTLNVNTISAGTIQAGVGQFSTIRTSTLFGEILSTSILNTSTLNVNTISSGRLTAGSGLVSTIQANTMIVSTITAQTANVSSLLASSITVSTLVADAANVKFMVPSSISTGFLYAGMGFISSATVSSLEGRVVNAQVGIIDSVSANIISTGVLRANTALFSTLETSTLITSTLNALQGNISTVNANFISAGRITTSNVSANTIFSFVTNTSTLNANFISAGILYASVISTTVFIGPGAASQSNYDFLSAGVFTAGSILTSTMNVSTLNTALLNTSTLNTNNFITSSLTTNGSLRLNYAPPNIWLALNYANTGDSRTSIRYSIDDGATFNNIVSGGFSNSTTYFSGIEAGYNGSQFVVVGSNISATSSIQFSSDGSNFRGSQNGGFNQAGNCVLWDGQAWLVGGTDSTKNNILQRGTTGSNWSQIGNNLQSINEVNGLAWNGNIYVAVGTGVDRIQYTTNPTSTWTVATGTLPTAPVHGIATNGFTWVAGGLNGLFYSPNGSNLWAPAVSGNFTAQVWDVQWNGQIWVAVGNGANNTNLNGIRYSFNGSNWFVSALTQQYLRSVRWNGRYWVAGLGANSGGFLYISYDGNTWNMFNQQTGSHNILSVNGLFYPTAPRADIVSPYLNFYLQGMPPALYSTNQVFASPQQMTMNNTLTINCSTNRVGINNTNPQVALDVAGQINATIGSFSTINVSTLSTSFINISTLSSVTINSRNAFFSSIQASTISAGTMFVSTISTGTASIGAFSSISSGVYVGGVFRVQAISTTTISSLNQLTTSTLNAQYVSAGFTTTSNLIVNAGATISTINTNTLSTGIINAALGTFSTLSSGVANIRIGIFSTLAIGGTLSTSNAVNVTGSVNASLGIFSNGNPLPSDFNIKSNIMFADLDQCYSNVRNLPLKRFTYIPEYSAGKQDKTQLGFIAQEVQEIFPKAIFPRYDENLQRDILHLNTQQIMMTQYGATQRLMSTIQLQTNTLSTLFSTVESLQQQISTLTGNNVP